jgi:hypothetical protein
MQKSTTDKKIVDFCEKDFAKSISGKQTIVKSISGKHTVVKSISGIQTIVKSISGNRLL